MAKATEQDEVDPETGLVPAPTDNADAPPADPNVSAAQDVLKLPQYNGPTSPTDPNFVTNTAGRAEAKPTPQEPSTADDLATVAGQAAKVAALGPLAPTAMAMPSWDTIKQRGGDIARGLGEEAGKVSPAAGRLLTKAGNAISDPSKPAAPPPAAEKPKTINVRRPVTPGQNANQDQPPVPPQAPSPQMDMPDPQEVKDASKQGLEANAAEGETQSKIAKEAQPLLQRQAEDAAAQAKALEAAGIQNNKEVQDDIDKSNAADKEARDMVNDPTAGPSHYWHSLSTGQNILYGIGIALNTAITAVSHGRIPNIGLDYFNGAIQRDTEQQLLKYKDAQTRGAHARDLAEISMRHFGDERVAAAFMNKSKADATAAQIEAIGGKYADEKIRNATNKAASDLRLKYANDLTMALKTRNDTRLQQSEIDRNERSKVAETALLPGRLREQQLKNRGLEAEQTVVDANGNARITDPQTAKFIHEHQAGAETRINALHGMLVSGTAQKADSPFNESDQKDIRSRLATLYPGVKLDLPSQFSPADLSRVVNGLLENEQAAYPH